MPESPPRMRITCPHCSASAVCGPEQMAARLRQSGMLRREKDASWDLIGELFHSAAARMACAECGHRGLSVSIAADDWDDEDWGESRSCAGCGQPIPGERLEAFPNAQLCVQCQRAADRGEDTGPPEYCPRCGTPMRLQQRRGSGLAGYQLVCPQCGR